MNLVTSDEVLSFLQKLGKSKAWLNTISSRYSLSPQFMIASTGALVGKSGRLFYYPKGIFDLITEIIELHDTKNIPFEEVARVLRPKVELLNKEMAAAQVITDGDEIKRMLDKAKARNPEVFASILKEYL